MRAVVGFLPTLTIVLLITLSTRILSAAESSSDDCKILEGFSGSSTGEFPKGWKPRSEAGRSIYSVRVEGGQYFVRAKAINAGIEADKESAWDLQQYPFLTWRWRPREFPRGANEQSGKNDSVLGVYVGFSWMTGALKYIWSESVPTGSEIDTGLFGRTKMKVVNSGSTTDKETWISVRVNVADDYKRRFKKTTIDNPVGIALLTDSDATQSSAEGDYAEFKICRK